MASGYWQKGKLDSAIHQIKFAIDSLAYRNSTSYELLANCYAEKNMLDHSVYYFDLAIKLDSTNVSARYHKAIQLLEINPNETIRELSFCEQSKNVYVKPLLYSLRGRAFGLLGDYAKAIEDLSRAIEINPNQIENYLDRGVSFKLMGNKIRARLDFKKAIELDNNNSFAKEQLDELK